MRKLIWIESDIRRAFEIANETYYDLWGDEKERGIASTFLFFGDAYKGNKTEQSLTEKQVQMFDEKVHTLMGQHCKNLEKWNYTGETFLKKKELIEEPSILLSEEDIDISEIYAKEDKYNIQPILDFVKIEDLTKIEKIEKIAVGINAILLFEDLPRVNQTQPIISMKLYSELTKAGYPCFVYSPYVFDASFVKEYKEIYKESFKNDVEITRKDKLINRIEALRNAE